MVARTQPKVTNAPLIAHNHVARRDATYVKMPLPVLAKAYRHSSAVPAYLTRPLSVKKEEPGATGQEQGKDRPRDKPQGMPTVTAKTKDGKKDAGSGTKGKGHGGKAGTDSSGPAKVDEKDAAPRKTAGGGGGHRLIGGGGTDTDTDKIFVPPPLPAVESGPALLYRTPLELRDSGPGFLAPAYLRHRAEQPAKALDDNLKNYAERFAEASGEARRAYDQILSRLQKLNEAARASEDRRFDARQQSLNRGLERLDEGLAAARALLAEAHAEQLTQLDFIVRRVRRSLLRVAGGGAAALDARATRIDGDLVPHRQRKDEIVGMPAAKSADITAAQAQAEHGLDALASSPADKLKGTGTAEGKAMAAAQEEAIIRDIKFPVAEAKLRLSKSTSEMTKSLAKQTAPLDASLCPSFCPFDGFKAVLRGEAVTAVWSAHGSSLKKLNESADATVTSLAKSYSQSEAGLIEQHNQLRAQLIDGARQRDKAERDQAKQQAARTGGSLAALAGAQSRAVIGIDETIARRRRLKEEDFAGAVISASQGLIGGGLETGRRQSAQIADQAAEAQARLDNASELAAERFKDGAEQSAARLGKAAAQTIDANRTMIESAAEGMAKLDEPIRSSFNGFLARVGGQCDAAIANLGASLAKTAERVKKGFAGPVDTSDGDAKDKPKEPQAEVKGKSGKDGTGAKESGPDPSVASCQAACPKPEKDGDKGGKSSAPDDKGGKQSNGKATQKEGGGEAGKQEYPDGYLTRLKGYETNPLAEPTLADYVAGMPGIVQRDLSRRARELDKLLGYSNSEPSLVLNELRGLTRLQGRAVEEVYPRGNLRADLDKYLNVGNLVTGVDTRVESIFAARAYLNGDTEAGAVHELNAAVNWSNDSKQIDTVLKGLTKDQLASMKARFPKELEVIRADLNDMDGKVWDKLTAGKLGEGEAWRLEEKLTTVKEDHFGEQESDKAVDAVSEAMSGTGTSRLGGAAQFADMEKSYETRALRQKQERTDLLTGFAANRGVAETGDDVGNALFDFASSQKTYYAFVPGQGPNGSGGKWEPRTKASEAQSRLLQQLIKTGEGSPESRAARLAVELGRPGGGKPERIRTATEDGDLNAALNNPAAHAAAAERQRKMYALVDQWAPNPKGDGKPRSTEDIQKDVAERLAKPLAYDEGKAKYVRSLVTGGPGDPKSMVVRLDYAMDGLGTNTEVLKQTLGSMTRDQFELVRNEYNKQHPNGPDLLTRIGIRGKGNFWDSEASGDAANELEILSMGIPRTERERAEVSAMEMKQQIRDSDGSLGPLVAGPEFAQLSSDYKRLMSVMGIADVGFDKDGGFVVKDANGEPTTMGRFDKNGAFIKQDGFTSDDLALAMTVGKISAENYKAATDAVADAIGTALVVTAAIVTTALTGGAAASIWIPVLVTAAAGVASMGVKYAIKGGRYGSEEMMFDLAATIVQAATAGIGAAAGTALRGGGKAVGGLAKSWRMSEQALATAAKGGGQAATKALPALSFGQELFVGALSSGFSGGAMAAINPDSYRGDNYAGEILHGIIKGSVSGAVGAGVTRGVMGGVTNLSRGMGARSGAAEALSRGMPAADAQRFAATRSRLFGTSALTEVGGRVVGSAANGIASRATEIGYDSAVRKRHIAAGQFWNEIGSAGLQSAIQAFGEGAIDRAIRSRSRSRLREHAFTTRDDIHDYRQRGAQAVVDEGIRRGIITPPPTPDAPVVGRPTVRPTVSVDEDGAPLPLLRPDGQDPAAPHAANDSDGAPVVHPLEDGGTPEAHRPGAEDPAARPGPGSDEPELRTASKVADDGIGAVLPGDPPRFPDGADLKPGMLDGMDPLKAGEKIFAIDRKDAVQARQNYEMLRARSPGREALLAHNPATGEWMVVQGSASTVKAPPEGWVTVRHSHPSLTSSNTGEIFARILPSGFTGDFTVLRSELNRMPGAELGVEVKRSSVIDIEVNGQPVRTTFEITRKGDNYSLSVTIDPPMHGQSKLGPFKGNYEGAFREYAYKGRELTDGVCEFGLDRMREARPDTFKAADEGPGGRVVRNATLAESERHDALFVAGRMAQAEAFDQQARGLVARGTYDPVVGHAATSADAHARVRDMGLVGQPDSLARLTRLLNSSDPAFTPAMRAAVAKAVLDATRAELVRTGGLAPGDELLMLFRGVTGARTDDYQKEGIKLSRLGPGGDEDAGRGLYGSQDFESALRYTGEGGDGAVLPLIVRRSELGNVVDVRSGTPLGDRWLAYIRATAGEGRLMPSHPHLSGVLDPRFNVPLGLGRGGRGSRFDDFLASLAADPTLPPAIREAARDPHITLMDLGGVASWGNDRSMLTDQFAMHHQRIADLFNQAHCFPLSDGEDSEGALLRSADHDPPKDKTTEAQKPLTTDPALTVEPMSKSPTPEIATDDPLSTKPHADEALTPIERQAIDATIRMMFRAPTKEAQELFRITVHLDQGVTEKQFARLLLADTPEARAAALRAIAKHLATLPLNQSQVLRLLTEVGAFEGRMRDRLQVEIAHGRDLADNAAAIAAVSEPMQSILMNSPLALRLFVDTGLKTGSGTKLYDHVMAKIAARKGKPITTPEQFEKFVLQSLRGSKHDTTLKPLAAQLAQLTGGAGDYNTGLEAGVAVARQLTGGTLDLTPSSHQHPNMTKFDDKVAYDAAATIDPGTRIEHPVRGRGTFVSSENGVAKISFDTNPQPNNFELVPVAELFEARRGTTDQPVEPVPLRSVEEQNTYQNKIDKHRTDNDLAAFDPNTKSGTIAIAKVGDREFIGNNSTMDTALASMSVSERRAFRQVLADLGGGPESIKQKGEFLDHAELAALVQARHEVGADKMPEVVELFVDRSACGDCRANLHLLARWLGVRELRIYYRNQVTPPPPLIIKAK